MRIAIMQPTYLPWLGYFELMHNCDLFVFLDDVQFVKKSWHHRNRVKTSTGETMLTVPVFSKGKRRQQIRETLINNELPWERKHFITIKNNYKKACFFDNYIDELQKIYSRDYNKLLDISIALIELIRREIGISTDTIMSSALNTEGVKSQKIINICKKLKSDVLYDTQGAEAILDLDLFEKNNIKVIYQRFKHPIYRHLHEDFISHLSALDLLFNEGEKALEIICSGYSS